MLLKRILAGRRTFPAISTSRFLVNSQNPSRFYCVNGRRQNPFDQFFSGGFVRRDFKDFDKVFESVFKNGDLNKAQDIIKNHFAGDWSPEVDIIEHENTLEFFMELPGMEKSDVKISLENNFLVIRGEKKNHFNNESLVRSERRFGKFSRKFEVPDVDRSRISATFNNGILKVVLNKTDSGSTINIEVD